MTDTAAPLGHHRPGRPRAEDIPWVPVDDWVINVWATEIADRAARTRRDAHLPPDAPVTVRLDRVTVLFSPRPRFVAAVRALDPRVHLDWVESTPGLTA